jgi:hypothetical protein
VIKFVVCGLLCLFASVAHAVVNSPTSVEIGFSYETEFETNAKGTVSDLMLSHAKFIYGYLQNESQVQAFGLTEGIEGVGAPLWPPKLNVLSQTSVRGKTIVSYRAEGKILLNKRVASALVQKGHWSITMPYDLDHFFIKKCGSWDNKTPEDFWYSYDPYKKGCEALRRPPLAKQVTLVIQALPTPPTLFSRLEELRGEGDRIFLVSTIDGFDSDLMTPNDSGRVSFRTINRWLRSDGFSETIVSKGKDWAIHRFDKALKRKDGKIIHVCILRFLGEVEIKEPNSVAFAQFLINAIHDSDVVFYDGHSGYGLNLQLENLEARAKKPVVFNNAKRQLFFFDSCSSYSYFMPVFAANKKPGTLDFLSTGLETIIEQDIPIQLAFYRQILDVNGGSPTWNEVISKLEESLSGRTFMLNVDVND